jgi:very-short-patch-repair endonuclease
MDKIDNILRNEGLQYTTIDYQGEKCYMIDSIKLYLYIRENKNSEIYKEFKAIVPTGYYFIWFTKTQVKKLKKIKALKDAEIREQLSKYQDGKTVVKNYANKMRENPTKSEDSLSKILEKNGIKYQQRVVIDCKVKKYIADFVVGKKVIEVDGKSHHKPKAEKYDAIRTNRLENLGYVVLRINNQDVMKEGYKLNELIKNLKN